MNIFKKKAKSKAVENNTSYVNSAYVHVGNQTPGFTTSITSTSVGSGSGVGSIISSSPTYQPHTILPSQPNPLFGGVSSPTWQTWTTGYQYVTNSCSMVFNLENDQDACVAKLAGVDFDVLKAVIGKPVLEKFKDRVELYFTVTPYKGNWAAVNKYLTSSGTKNITISIHAGADLIMDETYNLNFEMSSFDGNACNFEFMYVCKF